MVAYTIPAKSNRTAVRDGRRFILLANPRGDRNPNQNPHAGPGARIHLKTARTASSAGEHLPEAHCAFSGLVTFSVEGVVRVLEGDAERRAGEDRQAARDRGEGVAHLLAQAEQASPGDRQGAADTLAVAAGFKNYADLWAAIGKDDGEVVARQLIAWVI
jgi:hypothetical protein